MPNQKKLDFNSLETGFEFPSSAYRIDPELVAKYIQAVEETSDLFAGSDLVPPSAVAAYAQAALLQHIDLLPGTIHVSQDLEFLGEVHLGDEIMTSARVARKQERGKMRILNIELDVTDTSGKTVMKGKNSFILPEAD